jgi:long-chain acyl-CoA synthetase
MNQFNNIGEIIAFQKQFNRKDAFNWREKDNKIWHQLSNQDFFNYIFYFAVGLREMGLNQEEKNKVAIFAYQSPIWLIADFGSIIAGAISIPIFNNISSENFNYQINDCKPSYLFIDNIELLNNQEFNFDNFKKIILYQSWNNDNIESDFIAKYDNKKPHFDKIIFFKDLLIQGKKSIEQKKYIWQSLINQLSIEDLATIIYTSGTTGNPKGVMISHKNLLTQIADTTTFFKLTEQDKALSFLPLAHIFERMVMTFYLTQNIKIYFAEDIKNIPEILKEIKPTLMTTVPRMLEKVYNKIKASHEGKNLFAKILIKTSLKIANKSFYNKSFLNLLLLKIFDILVYRKFRNALGSNMRMIICGGAPLNERIENFYWQIGIKIFCGYGLTESSPVISANCPAFYKLGTVGKKYDSVTIKINQDKELLACGNGITNGYYNNPEATNKLFAETNWLKTGDLAEIDSQGFVKIIGRKKDVFKSSNGKFIHPTLLEQKLLEKINFISDVLIIADNRSFVSALLFVDDIAIGNLQKQIFPNSSIVDFINSQLLLEIINNKIKQINQELDHWENIRKFIVINSQLSIEKGEITPSMKIKRKIIEQKYQQEIDNLYQE